MSYKTVEGLKYTKKHEWARQEGSAALIGLCDYAQDKLGEIVFVELPDVGADLEAGKSAAVIESVKAVADLYSPLSGTVTEVNEALLDQPELINADPYGEAWVYKLEIQDEAELGNLMNKVEYEKFIVEEEEK